MVCKYKPWMILVLVGTTSFCALFYSRFVWGLEKNAKEAPYSSLQYPLLFEDTGDSDFVSQLKSVRVLSQQNLYDRVWPLLVHLITQTPPEYVVENSLLGLPEKNRYYRLFTGAREYAFFLLRQYCSQERLSCLNYFSSQISPVSQEQSFWNLPLTQMVVQGYRALERGDFEGDFFTLAELFHWAVGDTRSQLFPASLLEAYQRALSFYVPSQSHPFLTQYRRFLRNHFLMTLGMFFEPGVSRSLMFEQAQLGKPKGTTRVSSSQAASGGHTGQDIFLQKGKAWVVQKQYTLSDFVSVDSSVSGREKFNVFFRNLFRFFGVIPGRNLLVVNDQQRLLVFDTRTGKRRDWYLSLPASEEETPHKENSRIVRLPFFNSISSRTFAVYWSGHFLSSRSEIARPNIDIQFLTQLPRYSVAAYDLGAQGKLLWDTDLPSLSSAYQALSFVSPPALFDHKIYVGAVSLKKEEIEHDLVAMDEESGAVIWKLPLHLNQYRSTKKNERELLSDYLTSPPLVTRDSIFYVTNSATVVCVNRRKGTLRWEIKFRQNNVVPYPRGWLPHPPILVGNTLFITPQDQTSLFALDFRTGQLRYALSLNSFNDHFFYMMSKRRLGVKGDRGVALQGKKSLLLLTSGAWRLVKIPGENPPAGVGVLAFSHFFYPSQKGTIVALNVETGVAHSLTTSGVNPEEGENKEGAGWDFAPNKQRVDLQWVEGKPWIFWWRGRAVEGWMIQPRTLPHKQAGEAMSGGK